MYLTWWFFSTVRPVVSDEEYRQTEFIVQQFASGVGKELHKQLLEKAENTKNWVRLTPTRSKHFICH